VISKNDDNELVETEYKLVLNQLDEQNKLGLMKKNSGMVAKNIELAIHDEEKGNIDFEG
jgi:hypothetical protein